MANDTIRHVRLYRLKHPHCPGHFEPGPQIGTLKLDPEGSLLLAVPGQTDVWIDRDGDHAKWAYHERLLQGCHALRERLAAQAASDEEEAPLDPRAWVP